LFPNVVHNWRLTSRLKSGW